MQRGVPIHGRGVVLVVRELGEADGELKILRCPYFDVAHGILGFELAEVVVELLRFGFGLFVHGVLVWLLGWFAIPE